MGFKVYSWAIEWLLRAPGIAEFALIHLQVLLAGIPIWFRVLIIWLIKGDTWSLDYSAYEPNIYIASGVLRSPSNQQVMLQQLKQEIRGSLPKPISMLRIEEVRSFERCAPQNALFLAGV